MPPCATPAVALTLLLFSAVIGTAIATTTLVPCISSPCSLVDLNAALNVATAGDTVQMGSGTWTGCNAYSTTYGVGITKALTLEGVGFTVIDCKSSGGAITAGSSSVVTIRNLVIIRGYSSGAMISASGSGFIYLDRINATKNVLNPGAYATAVIDAANGMSTSVVLNNSYITYNSASYGIFTCGPTVQLANSIVSSNSANGAVVDYGSTVTVVNCTFALNKGTIDGGGMFIRVRTSGSVLIRDSTFYANTAKSTGGGLNILGAPSVVQLISTILVSNQAPTSGSALTACCTSGCTMQITDSTIINTVASSWMVHCDPRVSGCTECNPCLGVCDSSGCRGLLATAYVDCLAGNDSNSGNTTSPFRTLSYAVSVLPVVNGTVVLLTSCPTDSLDLKGKSIAFVAAYQGISINCLGRASTVSNSFGYSTSVSVSVTNVTFVGCGGFVISQATTKFMLRGCTFVNASGILQASNGAVVTIRNCTIVGASSGTVSLLVITSGATLSASGLVVFNVRVAAAILQASGATAAVNDMFVSNVVSTGDIFSADCQATVVIANTTVSFNILGGSVVRAGDGSTVVILTSKFTGVRTSGCGAVLSSNGARISITRCSVVNTTALGNGGFVAVSGGVLSLDNVVAITCRASMRGGVVYLENVSPQIRASSFINGTATYGGGFFAITESNSQQFNLSLTNSTFSGCTALYGGVGYLTGTFSAHTAFVNVCTFHGNSADVGGAFYLDLADSSVTVWINETTVSSNSATDGGAIWLDTGRVVLSTSTLVANYAPNSGGAIRGRSASVGVYNCTLQFNFANQGGAVFLQDGSNAVFVGTNMDNNVAQQGGAAVFVTSSRLEVTNSIVERGRAPSGGGLFVDVLSVAIITSSKFETNTASDTGIGGAIEVKHAYLTVRGTTFAANEATVYGGALHGSDHADITVADCHFTDNSATQGGGAIYLELKSVLSAADSEFARNEAGAGGSLYALASDAAAHSCHFQNDSATTAGGSIALFSGSSLNASSSVFCGASAQGDGGGIYTQDALTLELSTCDLTGNRAGGSGGGAAVTTTGISGSFPTIITIKSSEFRENFAASLLAGSGGGGLAVPLSMLLIENTTFSFNFANGDGGAVLLTAGSETMNSSRKACSGCRFAFNQGRRGGAVFCATAECGHAWANSYSLLNGNTPASGCYGADFATPPYSMVWQNLPSAAIKSGDYLGTLDSQGNYIISLTLEDALGTPVTCLAQEASVQVAFAPQSPGANLIGTTLAALGVADGTACVTFSDLLFAGSPGNYTLLVTGSTALGVPPLAYNFSLTGCGDSSQLGSVGRGYSACVCKAGYYTAADYSCVPCVAGTFAATPGLTICQQCSAQTYSDAQAQVCTACPAVGADCRGGILHRLPGYWYDPDSQRFLPCANPTACPADVDSLSQCNTGYQDFSCSLCASGYGDVAGSCLICPPVYASVLLLLLYIAVIIAYLVILVKTSNDPTPHNAPFMLKIILNYLQLLSIVATFGVYLNTNLGLALAPTQGASISVSIQPIDCLFGHNVYGQLTFYLLFPIVCPALVAGFYAVLARVRKQRLRDKVGAIISAVAICNYVVYPSLVVAMFKMFQCPSDTNRLLSDVRITCYRGSHIGGVVGAVLGLVLYGFGEPILGFVIMYRSRTRLNDAAMLAKYRFLYDGYTPTRFYWELVVLMRKTAMVILATFLSATILLQLYVAGVVLVITMLLQYRLRPFVYDELNAAEFAGLAATFFTIGSGLVLGQYPQGAGAYSGVALVVLVNVVVIVWMVAVALRGIPAVRKCCRLGAARAPAGSNYHVVTISFDVAKEVPMEEKQVKPAAPLPPPRPASLSIPTSLPPAPPSALSDVDSEAHVGEDGAIEMGQTNPIFDEDTGQRKSVQM